MLVLQGLVFTGPMLVQAHGAMAQDLAVEFDGDVFHLGHVEKVATTKVSSNQSVPPPNEYVLNGEDLDHWKKLFTVNQYEKMGDTSPRAFADEIVKRMLVADPGLHLEIEPGARDNDVVLDTLAFDDAHNVYEFDVQRYKRGKSAGQIVFYQYSLRLAAPLKREALELIAHKRGTWNRLIAGMVVSYIPVSELPL
jgi:hypothetical protein